MNDSKLENDNSVIDVVKEFDYSTQQETYNKKFVKWRNQKDNPYAYNFTENKKEMVFVEGHGFLNSSAAEAEERTLKNIFYVIGIAMLGIFTIANVLQKLFIQLLSLIGLNVHTTFFNSVIYGGRTEVATVLIFSILVKLLAPAIFVHSKFKIPMRVGYPCVIGDGVELILAISITLVVSVVMSIPSTYVQATHEIYSFFKAYSSDVSLWDQEEFIIYTVFDVIVLSVLTEILFRGEMFAVLRQFGDLFAIVVTSVLSGFITQDFNVMLGSILISIVSSIGLLRSNTIFTAIAVRVTYRMYLLSLTLVEMNAGDLYITRNLFMAAVLIVGLVVFAVCLINNTRRKRHFCVSFNMYVPMKRKFITALKSFPMSAVVFIALTAAALQAFI